MLGKTRRDHEMMLMYKESEAGYVFHFFPWSLWLIQILFSKTVNGSPNKISSAASLNLKFKCTSAVSFSLSLAHRFFRRRRLSICRQHVSCSGLCESEGRRRSSNLGPQSPPPSRRRKPFRADEVHKWRVSTTEAFTRESDSGWRKVSLQTNNNQLTVTISKIEEKLRLYENVLFLFLKYIQATMFNQQR